MTGLGLRLARRSLLACVVLALGAAATTTLLLIAATWLLLPSQVHEPLFQVIADPGTRYGAVLGAVLGAIPLLYLHSQMVRFGTTARASRLSALRSAGATPADLRRLVAVEVGLPTLVGAVLGVLVYGALRPVLRSVEMSVRDPYSDGELHFGGGDLALLPAAWPPGWSVLVVVFVAAGLSALVGVLTAMRKVRALGEPATAGPPRPIGPLLLASAAALLVATVTFDLPRGLMFPVVMAAVVGLLCLPAWIAYRLARVVERRSRSAATLVAARRVVQDPRYVGRSAGTVGVLCLVAGVASSFYADVARPTQGLEHLALDPYYTYSLRLVAVMVGAALVVLLVTQVLHALETTVDHARSYASLQALGLPVGSLSRALATEALLVALPLAVLGVLLGSVPYGLLGYPTAATWQLVALLDVAIVAAVVLCTVVAVLLAGPWLRRTVSAAHLRTA